MTETQTRASLKWPIVGSVAVLVLSPVLELLTGSELLYVLILPVLIAILWPLSRLSRREVGLRWGEGRAYGVALLYPLAVMGVIALLAWLAGHTRPGEQDSSRMLLRLLLMFLNTLIGGLITEEGLFRGWLWGSLERARVRPTLVLLWTSLVFTLWHVPVPLIEKDFALPPAMIPIYIGNVLLLGLNWGLLRLRSGSVLVPTLSHALWNALAYVLFGYGPKLGMLGIESTWLFGPERGVAGLVLNGLALLALWLWSRRARRSPAGLTEPASNG